MLRSESVSIQVGNNNNSNSAASESSVLLPPVSERQRTKEIKWGAQFLSKTLGITIKSARALARFLWRVNTVAFIAALLACVYSSINSGLAPLDTTAAHLSLELLKSKPGGVLVWSFVFAAGSQIINTAMNFGFFMNIPTRLMKSFKSFTEYSNGRWKKALSNFFLMGASLLAGVSIAAIAYDSTSFFTGKWVVLQYGISLLTFGSIFASRFATLNERSDQVLLLNNPDAQLVRRIARLIDIQDNPAVIRRINAEGFVIISGIVNVREDGDRHLPLNAQEDSRYFNSLAIRMDQLVKDGHLKIMMRRSTTGIIIDFVYYLGCGTLALVSIKVSGEVFIQKLIDGLSILFPSFRNVPIPIQIALGVIGAAPTVAFYAEASALLPQIKYNAFNFVLKNPWMLLLILPIVFFTGVSTAGNLTVIRSIANSTHNIFDIQPEGGWNLFDTIVFLLVTYATNWKSAANMVIDTQKPENMDSRITAQRAWNMKYTVDPAAKASMTSLVEGRALVEGRGANVSQLGIFGSHSGAQVLEGQLLPLRDDNVADDDAEFCSDNDDLNRYDSADEGMASSDEDNAYVQPEDRRAQSPSLSRRNSE